MAAYFIAHLQVPSFRRYVARYGRYIEDQLETYGGRLVVGTTDAEVVEGDPLGNWTVLIHFPSREAAMEWYTSSTYAPLKRLRQEELTTHGHIMLVDAP